MTKILLEQITTIEDIAIFSKAYQEGLIQINITKISKHLNKDRKTVKNIYRVKYLKRRDKEKSI